MKNWKPEDIIFKLLVAVSLISIVYCVAITIIDTVKKNPITIKDTPFSVLEPSIEIAKQIPEVANSFSNGYKAKEYDDECTVSKIDYDSIEVIIGDVKKTFKIKGVDIKYDVLESRLKEGDILLLDYVGLNTNIYFRDGTMIQHWLLLNGYAIVSDVEEAYREEYEAIQEMAKERKVGYWAD